MSFGIPVRNGLAVGLLASTFLSSLRIGGRPAMFLDFIGTNSLDSRVTFTRASTATFVGSNGLIQLAAIDAPRFDYDPVTLAPKGLLIEEQRTNLARYSEQFSDAAWSKFATATVTANTSTAPDGTTTADTLNMPASGDRINLSAIAITGGTTYTASLWLSGSGTTFISLASLGGTYIFAAQQITLTATPTRYTVSLVTNANNTSVFPIIGRYNGAVGAGTATSAVIWGYQLEAGSFATSYIPTVASQVTRSADVAAMTGTNFSSWYNQTEGTVLAAFDAYAPNVADGFGRVYQIDDATNNNAVALLKNNGSGSQFFGYVAVSGAGQATLFTSAISANTPAKVATAYKLNDFGQATNGGTLATDASGTIPTVTQMRIGSTSGVACLNGHIRSLAYYNTRLSNATIQALTA